MLKKILSSADRFPSVVTTLARVKLSSLAALALRVAAVMTPAFWLMLPAPAESVIAPPAKTLPSRVKLLRSAKRKSVPAEPAARLAMSLPGPSRPIRPLANRLSAPVTTEPLLWVMSPPAWSETPLPEKISPAMSKESPSRKLKSPAPELTASRASTSFTRVRLMPCAAVPEKAPATIEPPNCWIDPVSEFSVNPPPALMLSCRV